MKKVTLLIALAALMVFAGCKKENETNGTTLKASIEQHKGNGSKTSLHPISDTEAQIHWTGDESILVNNGTSTVTFSLVSKSDDGMSGTFNYDGSFTFGENNVAVYPETATLSIDGSTVGFTLPETQTFTAEGTFGEGMNPMLGTFTDPENFTMTSLCGVLGLQLTGDNIENVTSIEVESKLDEALNGEFSCTAANPVLSVVTAGTNKVKLEFQDPITLTSTAKKFYFVLPVGTLSGGFTLTVNIEGAEPITRSTTNDISIVLNCVNMMPEMPISAAPAIPDGAIDGKFTIAEGHQIYFSRGNLQYQASTGTWRFAEHQWDYVGGTVENWNGTTTEYGTVYENGVKCSNNEISQTYSGWIDLFGWGTSGYNHGAICYQPWATSTTINHYYPYGNVNYNLYDGNGQAEWGYNAIANGGNQENSGWRTLTNEELYYILYERDGFAEKKGHGNVNGVNGIILLPDAWTLPDGLSFTSGNSDWANVYFGEQWTQMEANGAVFFPAANRRKGTGIETAYGYYWMGSQYPGGNLTSAYNLFFQSGECYRTYSSRYYGFSVRLVRNVE